MILVHSKSKTPDEIEAFVAQWDARCPLAVVPTAYPDFDEARAAASGDPVPDGLVRGCGSFQGWIASPGSSPGSQ